jgi:hypothetical protein
MRQCDKRKTNQHVTILAGIQFAMYSTKITMCIGSTGYDSNGTKRLQYRFSAHRCFQCNAANISKTDYVWEYKKYSEGYHT